MFQDTLLSLSLSTFSMTGKIVNFFPGFLDFTGCVVTLVIEQQIRNVFWPKTIQCFINQQ